ncbi:MAG: sugar phosphate isomerase/epimerase [Thermoguttaceae bacterium]|jgi:sugar phosphate isomerase/epimerase|nr:sugar phosphate isomerase/epimerase [Thermoguttaceae bacterium]
MNLLNGMMTRRTMLARGAQAAALAAMASRLGPLVAAPGSRWFKIGACEWNLGKADPSSFDVAKQIGLDGVQVNMGSVANDMHLRKPEVQKAYLEAAKRTGLEIGSLAIGEMNNVPLKSDPRAEQWLMDSIDVCKALGISIVMPACFSKGDLDLARTQEIDHLVKVLKRASAKAEKAGITIGLESYLSAEDNLVILDRVASPALKVYYDVGNSTDKGRDVLKEIPLLGKRICEFHFKDGQHMLGQGRIDFKKVRKALDQIEYSGWIQIEAAAPHGVLRDYAAHYKFLRTIYPERK